MTIDGVNISTYNAKLLESSFKEIWEYPSLKNPDKNNWAEEDGLEVDLTNPVLDKKEFQIEVLIEESSIDDFIEYLNAKTYRFYWINDTPHFFEFRVLSIMKINKPQGKFSIDIKLADDKPLRAYTYTLPSLTAVNYGFHLDENNVSIYGLVPLYGSKKSLEDSVKTKKKLEIKSKYSSGVVVSEQASKKEEHNATIGFFTKQTVSDFIVGYKAFLFDLVRPGSRKLKVDSFIYSFYYSKSKINDFEIVNGFVYCSFEIIIKILLKEDAPEEEETFDGGLILNGSFDLGLASWQVTGNWTSSNGTAKSTVPDNGGYLVQDVAETGKTYRVKFDVVTASGINNCVVLFGSVYDLDVNGLAVGSYDEILTASSGTFIAFFNKTGGTGTFEIDNVSITEII